MDSLSVEKAREMSPLTLAFYGDSVYETLIRRKIVEKGSAPSHKLHAQSVAMARAGFQARAAELIQPLLTEQEADILRRGRNASGATVPRSSNPKDYRLATALEALFGFLLLTGGTERAEELFEVIYNEKQRQENQDRSEKKAGE